jgi:hypothetical protein
MWTGNETEWPSGVGKIGQIDRSKNKWVFQRNWLDNCKTVDTGSWISHNKDGEGMKTWTWYARGFFWLDIRIVNFYMYTCIWSCTWVRFEYVAVLRLTSQISLRELCISTVDIWQRLGIEGAELVIMTPHCNKSSYDSSFGSAHFPWGCDWDYGAVRFPIGSYIICTIHIVAFASWFAFTSRYKFLFSLTTTCFTCMCVSKMFL